MQIVRVSGILPIGQAQRMKKQELADFLFEKMQNEETAGNLSSDVEKSGGKEEASTNSETPVEAKPAAKRRGRKPKAAVSEQSEKTSTKKTTGTRKRKKTEEDKAQEEVRIDRVQVQDEDEQISLEDLSKENTKEDTKAQETEAETEESSEKETLEVDNFVARPRPRNKNQEKDKKEQVQETGEGVLELMPDGYGFLRFKNYIQGPNDIYVSAQLIKKLNLRAGDYIKGTVRNKRDQDRYQALSYVTEINGEEPEKMAKRPHFDRLTPIYPNDRYVLETKRQELSTRIIDLFSPIGKGQRGMIVSPPKAGKTILLQKIANAISINNPEAKLIVLLIDERPEEVTDMQRRIKGEVVYSTFDKTPENHVKITELVLERAKRLVELGQDVVILLDSMTRMARAYNLTITPTGRTLSGGLDPGALHHPKRFFGAARKIENGGSLTIVATALVDTGSRMDEVIFEEFKGTGNMEVALDRKLSEKRIFPAININASSTRREELLLSQKELEAVWGVRKAFGQLDTADVTELIISLLLKTKDNEHLVESLNLSLKDQSIMSQMHANVATNGNQDSNGRSNFNGNGRTVSRFS